MLGQITPEKSEGGAVSLVTHSLGSGGAGRSNPFGIRCVYFQSISPLLSSWSFAMSLWYQTFVLFSEGTRNQAQHLGLVHNRHLIHARVNLLQKASPISLVCKQTVLCLCPRKRGARGGCEETCGVCFCAQVETSDHIPCWCWFTFSRVGPCWLWFIWCLKGKTEAGVLDERGYLCD